MTEFKMEHAEEIPTKLHILRGRSRGSRYDGLIDAFLKSGQRLVTVRVPDEIPVKTVVNILRYGIQHRGIKNVQVIMREEKIFLLNLKA